MADPMTAVAHPTNAARRRLEVLARRAAAFPNLGDDVEDEVATLSTLTDLPARERTFSEVVGAYRRGEHQVAQAALDRLIGAAPLAEPTPAPPATGSEFGVRYKGAFDHDTNVAPYADEAAAARFLHALQYMGNTDAVLVERVDGTWVEVAR